MKNNSRTIKNKLMIIILTIVTLVIVGIIIHKNVTPNNNENEKEAVSIVEKNQTEIVEEKIDIIDVNSNTRPYAVVVNNTAVAVKVQEGLNKAYLVYEIPTEGNTSRLMALYKDVEESLVIGTVRSARHNFVDFALESDAIFCCFGWSHYAEKDMKKRKYRLFSRFIWRTILQRKS